MLLDRTTFSATTATADCGGVSAPSYGSSVTFDADMSGMRLSVAQVTARWELLCGSAFVTYMSELV